MLAVQRRSGTAFLSASTTSVRSLSARRNACSSPTPGRSTVNSSPPIRPTIHFSGPAVRMRVATTALRKRSPAGRPTSRLSAYIPSRSIEKKETVPSLAIACVVARPKAGASRSAALAAGAACRFAIAVTSFGEIYIGQYIALSSGLRGGRPDLDWLRQAPRGHPPRASARTPAQPATRRGRSRTVRGGIERGGPGPAELGWYRGPTGRPMRDGRSLSGGIVVTEKTRFAAVGSSVDLPELEHGVLELWERERTFDLLRQKNAGGPRFSFIDGPITANVEAMGIHHGWSRTYKDVYQRYQAMLGKDQRYQNGFDCQGLWVEVQVERELNLNSKREIESYGIDRFWDACRARVDRSAAAITKQSIRLGQWMDWDHSYYTYDDNNISHIWHVLKICQDRGWLYRCHRSMPWCARCGTALSQHEMTMSDSYREMTHKSILATLVV